MSDLIILLLHESNKSINNEIIDEAKNIVGISVIDFKNDNKLYDKYINKISDNGNFFLFYNGKTEIYEANHNNLLKIKRILSLFLIPFFSREKRT